MKRFMLILGVFMTLTTGIMGRTQEMVYRGNTISGPYTHRNLSIFLIRGKFAVDVENILTLDEAIEQKAIVIYETGDVNELGVENVSEKPVFIQSGDIVKGGKQDRVLQFDLVIHPKSDRMPIAAFCVEQGRWSRRGEEDAVAFGSSKKQLASKELKLAAKLRSSQQEVWEEVASVQEKLGRNVSRSVRSAESASSLQLTLEDEEIGKRTRAYIDGISELIRNKKDIIGFAFAINGEMNSADMYGSSVLFQKLLPKMLEACATEALAELKEGESIRDVSVEDVIAWLEEADKGNETEKSVNERIHLKVKESEKDIVFETYDASRTKWIHKNVIKK